MRKLKKRIKKHSAKKLGRTPKEITITSCGKKVRMSSGRIGRIYSIRLAGYQHIGILYS